MHIPDGFLSTPVWVALDAVSLPAVGLLARRAQRDVEESRVPLLGVMGAFVFAAQMINFPVGVGTSGHLVGSALLACTLGPAAAAVVMTAILAVQALVFQDGGILVLGANVSNMAVAGVLAGYLPFHYWANGPWRKPAVFLGGFLSVLVAVLLALSQLLLSGVKMPVAVVGVSLGLFLLTAVLEGAITVAVFQAVERLHPRWIRQPAGRGNRAIGALAALALVLVSVGVLFASSQPDGLEKLAGNLGIADRARTLLETPLMDYEARWFESSWMRKASAGVAGLAIIYLVCAVVGRRIARRRSA